MKQVVCAMILATLAVWIIHCNIWYYSKPKKDREEAEKELDVW